MLRHACSRVLLSQCSPRSVSSLPIVHHEAYSAPILPQGHRFPMAVFQSIYNMLLEENIAQTDQVTAVKHASSVAAVHVQFMLTVL